MQHIFRLLRISAVFIGFVFLGLLLVVLFLGGLSVLGQNILALAFAFIMTRWFIRRTSARKPKAAKNKIKSSRSSSRLTSQIPRQKKNRKVDPPFDSSTQKSRKYQARLFNQQSDKECWEHPLDEGKGVQKVLANQGAVKSVWFDGESSAVVANRQIGGLVYVGTPPRSKDGGLDKRASGFIDPCLPVANSIGDIAGSSLNYWPDYVEMSPLDRATYLNWLATGRSDKSYSVGYLFLYFYGLERRFFIDVPNDDGTQIIAEVTRLRELYFDNRTVRRYLGDFLDVAYISTNSIESIKPDLSITAWDVPYSSKYSIGATIALGEKISAEWLLGWFLTHPEKSLRTPADRCKDEFLALFQLRFDSRFPDGLKVNRPRRKLSVEYPAASGDFVFNMEPSVDGQPVPDISSLRKPIEIAQEIADEVMAELDKLSRYLGRNKNGRGTIESHALMPPELWEVFPNEQVNQLAMWVGIRVSDDNLVPVLDVVERLEGARPAKLTKRTLTGAADALARIGYGMAPDPRYALRSPKLDEPVVLFRLDEPVAELESVSQQYKTALVETAAKTFVAHADGEVTKSESESLFESLGIYNELSSQERRRLTANLQWMLAVPLDLTLLRRKLKDSSPETASGVRGALVSAALADGTVKAEEVAGIEKLYKALGFEVSQVYSDLHSGDVVDGLVTVRQAERADSGEAIRPEACAVIPKLDASRIAAIRTDTARVSSVLGEIFVDKPEKVQGRESMGGSLEGLDESHSRLVQMLIAREEWAEEELQDQCVQLNLMLSGATETINEWAFEMYDEALVEEYEGFQISPEIADLIGKKLQGNYK